MHRVLGEVRKVTDEVGEDGDDHHWNGKPEKGNTG